MRKQKFLPTMLGIVFALACSQFSVSAQTEDKNRIANITASGDSVRWEVLVQNSGVTLSIGAANGKVYRKEFKSGESPVFAIYDKSGSKLPDGQYNYELRLAPVLSPEIKREMMAARAKGEAAEEEMEARVNALLPPYPLVQSGAFSIIRGTIVIAGAVEPGSQASTNKSGAASGAPGTRQASARRAFVPGFSHAALPDQVIPDDLIVQFSECVGNDCVNGESFSFDTIRMKENNTRLAFNDTSVGSFPTRDWRIRANSSASGGLSALFFDDMGTTSNGDEPATATPFTIESGSATNALYIDSTSRIGMRTSTPTLDIHTNTSNTPAIRLEQNNSGGFTAQTWDIGSNEANFFIRDVTGGSKLSLRIRPGAPTSSLDISSDGDVGIGTASPDLRLEVFASGAGLPATSGTAQTGIMRLSQSAGVGVVDMGFGGGAGFGWIQVSDSTNLATEFGLLLNPNGGNVAIGTTSPTSPADKLEVAGGNIRVTGGSFIDDGTTLNVPDYVFEENYPLMTLDELRAYIAREKHLPKMPSASDVRRNGLNVSHYQMRLLEKIEELTLHVLSEQEQRKEQQKQIEELKAQIQQLKSRSSRGARNRRR